jgi:signal transduction histidine kinase/DNA-binding response OmpR family regulator
LASTLRLLLVEDSEDDCELLRRELRRGGYTVELERVWTVERFESALDRTWDLLISDWTMPGFGGEQVLELLAARRLDLPCIVFSGTPGEENAVQALRLGALDFLSKDKPGRLVPAVQRALRESADRRARFRIEQELMLSEERYRTGFHVAPEALLTYDLEQSKIIDGNPSAMRLFQCTLDELCAGQLGDFSPLKQPDGTSSADAGRVMIGRALAGETTRHPWVFEIAGEQIPTEIHLGLLPTQTGKLARVAITDLRERIRAEELRRRSIELELQNRRFQEASRLKSEFLANMSHELRTPLNAIIGFAELLHDGHVERDSPQHQEFLTDILVSGRHLLQLINDVLDLAKVEAGKLDFRPEPVDLARLVGEVVAILRTTAANKRIEVATEIDPQVRHVVLDPARFKQVAYNYLSNALKFTAQGGRVTARIVPQGTAQFRFEVEDTGIGIAMHDLPRLFIEFQQLEAGVSKRHGGTGLGLALTRRLVEAQGGDVGVHSKVGAGSTFFAVLPRRAAPGAELPQVPRTTTRDGARTVLVVEDDARDQAQLVSTLASAGYSVELATTGAEALALWRTRRFDAVTIDLLLPDMNGIDLLAALNGDEKRRLSVPVIVVTVVPDHTLLAGYSVHEILHKPVNRDSLVASLARAGVRGLGVKPS